MLCVEYSGESKRSKLREVSQIFNPRWHPIAKGISNAQTRGSWVAVGAASAIGGKVIRLPPADGCGCPLKWVWLLTGLSCLGGGEGGDVFGEDVFGPDIFKIASEMQAGLDLAVDLIRQTVTKT